MASQQETFDKIVNHLRKQNARCIDNNGCVYRGKNNMKCAAGCLIPDEVYSPELERHSVRSNGGLTRAGHLIIGLGHNIDLVFDLQLIHDCYETTCWEKEFKGMAEKYDLVYTPYISIQETFDKVVEHLRKQNCKSATPDICLYRGPNNTKCAAGCLIPDELYVFEMENKSCHVSSFVETKPMPAVVLDKLGYNTLFVRRLQKIHDYFEVNNWEIQFELLAREFSLKYQPPVN